MNEQWQKLSKKELIELYESKAKLLNNEASEVPLLSLCAAFTLVGSSFPNFDDKLNLRFINSLANSIYHHHENSFLIQTAIKGRTEVNKTTVINTLGMLGIKEMDKNITQVLQLQDCFIILFLIYLKNNNCDLEELLSYLGLNIRHNNQTESQNLSVKNVDNKKFNNLTEYYQFLCDKLNENGFKYPNIMSGELGPWEVKQYFMSSLTTNHAHQYQAFKFLKENGYFNLGICPNCGNQLNEIKYTYTSGFNSNINYPICKSCYTGGRETSINPASDKKGCYIATVCYGDYDSNEVKVFRKYRDKVLSKNIFGRIFIQIYYFLSPSVANYLKERQYLNSKIKLHILDKIYKKMAKRYE